MIIQESTRNQIQNASNPHQGSARRVLCVCSAGLLRSATAANVLHKEFGFNTRSAGISEYALVPVSQVLITWADEIVCMHSDHTSVLRWALSEDKELSEDGRNRILAKVTTLDVPDRFDFMDEELQRIILEQFKETEQ